MFGLCSCWRTNAGGPFSITRELKLTMGLRQCFTITLELKKEEQEEDEEEEEEEKEGEEEDIYKINQETSFKTCNKCITTKNRTFFDENKSTCKQCLSEKISCKYCPFLMSRGNITTDVKKMHEASYNFEQCMSF